MFHIPCLRHGSKARDRLDRPAIAVTDFASLSHDQVRSLLAACRLRDRTLVIVAPGFGESAIESDEPNVIGVSVGPDERDTNAIEDIAAATSATFLSVQLGFGLTLDPKLPSRSGNVILPRVGWQDVSEPDLGSPQFVRFQDEGATFECPVSPGASRHVEMLQRRARLARSEQDLQALRVRLSRFGANDSGVWQPIDHPRPQRTDTRFPVPSGFASPYFVTDPDRFEAVVAEAKVLVVAFPLDDTRLVTPALDEAAHRGSPLVVVAPMIRGGALATLVVNRLRGTALSLAIEMAAPDVLRDLASFTGATLVTAENEADLRGKTVLLALGRARQVTARRSDTEFQMLPP